MSHRRIPRLYDMKPIQRSKLVIELLDVDAAFEDLEEEENKDEESSDSISSND